MHTGISCLLAAVSTALMLAGCASAPARRVIDDAPFSSEAELPRLEALVFKSNGSTIYGQILVPSSAFKAPRPCAVLCHGFAGFTRWDDVAHDLCRAGIAVVIPHHRGAWGSEGEYSVTGCIEDAENLAQWTMSPSFAEKYGTATNSVFLIGHSMGGNSVLNAAAKVPGVKGVALIAPCDIGYMAGVKTKRDMHMFLVGEGLHALRCKSDKAVVEDIYENASTMRFEKVAKSLPCKGVFLATGVYDKTVPQIPLVDFWSELPDAVTRRVRKSYRAGHGLMGCRRDLAADLADFILAKDEQPTSKTGR